MSIKIMSLVWENFPRGGSDMLAMLAMADWCNDQGGSLHPSIASVAKKIRLTEKQARVIVHRLIDEGWLAVIGNENGGNPGQSRLYQLNVKKLATPPVEVTPPAKGTPPVEVRDPSRGGSFTPPAHGSLTTIEPSITTSKRTAPATRLPADWSPSAEDIEFCIRMRPDLNVDFIADGFRDYWLAAPGAKGRKQDWAATWRNWVRNQRQQTIPTGKQANRDSYAAQAAEAARRIGEPYEPDERDITGICSRIA